MVMVAMMVMAINKEAEQIIFWFCFVTIMISIAIQLILAHSNPLSESYNIQLSTTQNSIRWEMPAQDENVIIIRMRIMVAMMMMVL